MNEACLLTEARASELAARAVARCRQLAAVTDVPGQTTRTFLSEGMRRANAQVAAWMHEAGMVVQTDAAGNLRGVLGGVGRGDDAEQAPCVLASHLDTVPYAGAFDGVLGVALALELAGHLGGTLPFPLHVIAFSEEEGVRFGVPFLGSRALVGELDDALLGCADREGTTVREAIGRYGLCCDDLPAARLGGARAYLEFHIEQGPVLEAEGLPLGVVDRIVGQTHAELHFKGTANHAGTTPMHLRHDALAAAAAWIVAVEQYAREHTEIVATVGHVEVAPGARNVVAGDVRCTLDVRSGDDTARNAAAERLVAQADQFAQARTVAVTATVHAQQPAIAMDSTLVRMLETAVRAEGLPVRRMDSGAGHDAMVVAPHLPAAMLFLRTPGGLSHHPDETVLTTDVADALRVGVRFLYLLGAPETTA